MKYQREDSSIYDEAFPLFEKHFKEVGWKGEVLELNPNEDVYKNLDKYEALRVYTVRDGTELVGYAVYLVFPHMHHNNILRATNDIVYVDEAYRGIGIKLLKFAEQELKDEGIQMISMYIRAKNDWGNLAVALGYENVETGYFKLIGD